MLVVDFGLLGPLTVSDGETALAVHFAHQVAGDFPDGQLYVNLRGFDPAGPPMPADEAIRILLDALGVPAAQVPASLEAQAGLYRSLLAGRRMLVLLDNARDIDQVRPLLPGSPGCLVIITSRGELTGLVGLHPGPDISAPAAASMAGLPPRETRHILGQLTGAHLLAEHAHGRFSCHDLLRAYAAEHAHTDDSDSERHAATHRMLDHYLHTAHDATLLLQAFGRAGALPDRQAGVEPEPLADAGQALAWFDAERPVLMAATAQALVDGFYTHACQIPWAMARFLDLQGHWIDGQALDLLQGLGSLQAEAGTWDSLGYAHHHLGDHAESAACYRRALDLFREIGDRWGEATTLDHIGEAHHAAGSAQQARAVWEESLAILDDIHHPDASQVRAKLAGLGAAPGT
jgi:tetratricopeptide (TPR) repeat protein